MAEVATATVSLFNYLLGEDHAAAGSRFEEHIRTLSLPEIAPHLDSERKILWCHQQHAKRLSFTPQLLSDIRRVQSALESLRLAADEAAELPVRYVVWASSFPGVFNLGGHLELISSLIRTRSREGLAEYGRACIDICYPNSISYGLPVVTISLVQGDALGGGFEAALSSDLIIAEESAKFGLPEVLFNLFPGMGALSFLGRRIGRSRAEALVLEGKTYTAREMADLGVVDMVVPDGTGEQAVADYADRTSRFFNARQAVMAAQKRVDPVSLSELLGIVDIWVEAALRLGDSDLRRIERFIGSQERRRAAAQHAFPAAPAALAGLPLQ